MSLESYWTEDTQEVGDSLVTGYHSGAEHLISSLSILKLSALASECCQAVTLPAAWLLPYGETGANTGAFTFVVYLIDGSSGQMIDWLAIFALLLIAVQNELEKALFPVSELA